MKPSQFVKAAVAEIREAVGDGAAISALSGGVDSAVVTVLGHKAIGSRLKVIFIDDGLMRQGEPKEVKDAFAAMGIKVKVLKVAKRFFEALAGITDPEEKRKAFRDTFYKVLGEAVKASGAQYLLQGTIAADVIETKGGVKTQHNVLEQIGIDTKKGYGFRALEPIRTLFKPDVRRVARGLGMPKAFSERMPFPGPGLATRCVGEVTPKRIEIVRRACKIAEEETVKYKPFQAFGVLLADKATGLRKNGKRAFGDIVVFRSVQSEDAMTATATQVAWPVLERIRDRILDACPTVTKVLLDLTPKPPSTIEYI
ncbi:MAG: ExsB family transcriptional regulator [Candidatus Brocadiae bacterium]|nr:ExsB family transcriptional regulator [Candidatus Brocadiia bacterium]